VSWFFSGLNQFFPSYSLDRRDSREEILFPGLEGQFYRFLLSRFSAGISEPPETSSCPSALSCGHALTGTTRYFKRRVTSLATADSSPHCSLLSSSDRERADQTQKVQSV